jgi:hypothetical protein
VGVRGGGRLAGRGPSGRGNEEADEALESSGKPLRSAHLEKVVSNAIKDLGGAQETAKGRRGLAEKT